MRVLILLVTFCGVAAADSYSFVEYSGNRWHDGHTEISGAIAHRDGQLAGVTLRGRQAELALARRGKRFATELAYDVALVDAGVVHSAWLRERVGLGVIGGYSSSLRRYEGWLEAGAGAELFDWSHAGHHARPALSLGFGTDFTSRTNDDDTQLRWLGARLAVRMLAARPPGTEVACAGVCTPPATRTVDLAIVVSLSLLIGR